MDTRTIICIAACTYLLIMNIVSFSLMALDKKRARKDTTHSHPETRIPEKTLFLVTALFGGVGGCLGMFILRHKTKHWYFALFFPLMAILQIAAIVYFMCHEFCVN